MLWMIAACAAVVLAGAGIVRVCTHQDEASRARELVNVVVSYADRSENGPDDGEARRALIRDHRREAMPLLFAAYWSGSERVRRSSGCLLQDVVAQGARVDGWSVDAHYKDPVTDDMVREWERWWESQRGAELK